LECPLVLTMFMFELLFMSKDGAFSNRDKSIEFKCRSTVRVQVPVFDQEGIIWTSFTVFLFAFHDGWKYNFLPYFHLVVFDDIFMLTITPQN
jgi:hypothetical protein